MYNRTVQKKIIIIISRMWNGEFELSDGSYSVPYIQSYIE